MEVKWPRGPTPSADAVVLDLVRAPSLMKRHRRAAVVLARRHPSLVKRRRQELRSAVSRKEEAERRGRAGPPRAGQPRSWPGRGGRGRAERFIHYLDKRLDLDLLVGSAAATCAHRSSLAATWVREGAAPGKSRRGAAVGRGTRWVERGRGGWGKEVGCGWGKKEEGAVGRRSWLSVGTWGI
jgi:hypothetical protein